MAVRLQKLSQRARTSSCTPPISTHYPHQMKNMPWPIMDRKTRVFLRDAGGKVDLWCATLGSIGPDISEIGARMGMSFVLFGTGVLIGNSIAETFLKSGSGNGGLQLF